MTPVRKIHPLLGNDNGGAFLQGDVKTSTLKAFTLKEIPEILKKLPQA